MNEDLIVKHCQSNYYLRALVFGADFDTFFNRFKKRCKMIRVEHDEINNDLYELYFCYAKITSTIPERLKHTLEKIYKEHNKLPEGSSVELKYLPIYIYRIKKTKLDFTLMAGPSLDAIKCYRPPWTKRKYVLCDLYKLCDVQYSGLGGAHYKISRLNIRHIYDTSGNGTGVTIYGDDVLNSVAFKDMLSRHSQLALDDNRYKNNWEDFQVSPFAKKEELPGNTRIVEPKSLKYTFDDAIVKPINLNIDTFGNFSYYQSGFKGMNALVDFFIHLEWLETLRDTDYDPLLRSDEALKRVQALWD